MSANMLTGFVRNKKVILSLLFFIFSSRLLGQDGNSQTWSFRFGSGAIFPDASEIVGANSPNGLNISAGLGYQYFSHLHLLGTVHFDYFINEKRTDFKTYIIVLNLTAEARWHVLSLSRKISPYLVGGVAPALYVNTKPYVESGDNFDPYTTSRDYELKPGYTLKYGIGSNFIVGGDLKIFGEWVYSRFGFFSSRQPLYYRAFMIGFLLDIDWIYSRSDQ